MPDDPLDTPSHGFAARKGEDRVEVSLDSDPAARSLPCVVDLNPPVHAEQVRARLEEFLEEGRRVRAKMNPGDLSLERIVDLLGVFGHMGAVITWREASSPAVEKLHRVDPVRYLA